MIEVIKVPKLIRDPDSGRLVINNKRGRKMPRKMVAAALDRLTAKIVVDGNRSPMPF